MAGKRRDKGQSHSMRPVRVGPPKWVRYSAEEIGALAAELARMGYMPSMIGVILRDQYGIPLVKSITGMKLVKLLEKYGVRYPIPEDLLRLMARAVNLRKHLKGHPKDTASMRGLIEIESKIRALVKYYESQTSALVKYYKSLGKLPQDFEYDPAKAEIWVSQYLGRGTIAELQQSAQQK
ncbi:MAG: 30S ribosomal protein S15 [Ignisphaera sp.]